MSEIGSRFLFHIWQSSNCSLTSRTSCLTPICTRVSSPIGYVSNYSLQVFFCVRLMSNSLVFFYFFYLFYFYSAGCIRLLSDALILNTGNLFATAAGDGGTPSWSMRSGRRLPKMHGVSADCSTWSPYRTALTGPSIYRPLGV